MEHCMLKYCFIADKRNAKSTLNIVIYLMFDIFIPNQVNGKTKFFFVMDSYVMYFVMDWATTTIDAQWHKTSFRQKYLSAVYWN